MLDKRWQPVSPPIDAAERAQTIGEMFLRRVELDRDRVAFRQRRGGAWVSIAWQDVYDRAAAIAAFLTESGVAPGDAICIVGSTCPEWCYADLGGHLAGAITIGAYPTLAAGQLAYVISHSDSVVAFVEGVDEVHKLIEMRAELPRLRKVCVWNEQGLAEILASSDWVVSLASVLRTRGDARRVADTVAGVAPDRTAILVYTSGTTGAPKGAMISHRNVLEQLRAVQATTPVDHDDMAFSFLPMAHVAERILGFYGRIARGMATTYASSLPAVLDELRAAMPTQFGSVPRLFEKAHARIFSAVEAAPRSRRRLFRWAERVGREVVRRWQADEPVPLPLRVQYALADRLVFARLRQVFGGRVRALIIGAAPTAPEILEFFWAAGFPLYEAYGLTEATAVTHANQPGAVRIGSVGHALSCVEERIADDGELLVRGPCVFQGYYKDPDATAAVIDADGWLHTGDIVRKDDDGYLTIVDRKKHLIITSGGKNIAPATIENQIKAADPMISQVHAHGDRRPYVTALITIAPADAIEYARAHALVAADQAERLARALAQDPFSTPPGLAEVMRAVTERPDVRERIAAAVRRANQQLARVETVKKVHLLDRELSMQQDELTPTLKVKRKAVEARFAAIFDRLYAEPDFGVRTAERP